MPTSLINRRPRYWRDPSFDNDDPLQVATWYPTSRPWYDLPIELSGWHLMQDVEYLPTISVVHCGLREGRAVLDGCLDETKPQDQKPEQHSEP
jgi:hypothetical protein